MSQHNVKSFHVNFVTCLGLRKASVARMQAFVVSLSLMAAMAALVVVAVVAVVAVAGVAAVEEEEMVASFDSSSSTIVERC